MPCEVGQRRHRDGTVSEEVDTSSTSRPLATFMYAMLGTRPDIAKAVGKLAQYSNEPRVQHWNAVRQLRSYLATTEDQASHTPARATSTLSPSSRASLTRTGAVTRKPRLDHRRRFLRRKRRGQLEIQATTNRGIIYGRARVHGSP